MTSEKPGQKIDSVTKKKISNEKRLKAVTEWKKNRCFQSTVSKAAHKIYNTEVKNQLKLFDSDDDEEEEKHEECFKIRPQFEGAHGQKLLEMSTMFSGRFKLDERFKEDDYQPEPEKDEEKEKNLKILETVLGHGVSSKAAEKCLPEKRQMRFDPEDNSAAKYIKSTEAPSEKPKKRKSKKADRVESDNVESDIHHPEHYIEVSSNLKDILSSSSTPFSLTQKFTYDADVEVIEPLEKNGTTTTNNKNIKETIHLKNAEYEGKNNVYQKSSTRYFSSNLRRDSFFIKADDTRLKEGVKFFKRPKPLEEIRIEWQRRREAVLELFRRKSRSSQRSHTNRVRTTQMKNALRKQNFKT